MICLTLTVPPRAKSASGPKRIQRRRSKGARMPAGAVYVGRPTKWGNPYVLSDRKFAHADGTPAPFDEPAARAMCVRDFWAGLLSGQFDITAADVKRELRGKDLSCWCRIDQECHADVLLEIANS